jgi:7-cyano-7-deazaguanine synthase in queuosine biosynthesis
MKYVSRVDGTEIVVDIKQSTNYGIMLSGGLDSAVLLYLMLKACPTANIQIFYIAKYDGSYTYLDKIIQYLNTAFGIVLPAPIEVGSPDIHHTQINQTGIKHVLFKYPKIEKLFIGINQNPPQPWGDPKWVFPIRPTENTNPRLDMPFMMLYKTHIVDLALQENQENLLMLTHTCTEQVTGSCMKCFQCNERAWAFEKLNVLDPALIS